MSSPFLIVWDIVDYMSDLEVPKDYSSHNMSLLQLQTVQGQAPRDQHWQGLPSFTAVNSPCPNCQPLLQSLSIRLSNLEKEVEKLKREQNKVRSFMTKSNPPLVTVWEVEFLQFM